MKPETVCTVVFSPTGTSKKIAETVARSIASDAGTEAAALKTIDLTHAAAHSAALSAGAVAVIAAKLKDVHTPLVPMLRFIRFVVGYRRRQKKNPVVYLPACDADRCTHCGRCAAICPTQAIARGDEAHTDPARCIRCCACVKGCPVGARSFHTPFAAALARSFTRRKQPVTIL